MLAPAGRLGPIAEAATSRHESQHSSPQPRQYLLGKPGIAFQPDVVSRTWVRQWQDSWPVLSPGLHGLGNAGLLPARQMPVLGVLADNQDQLHVDKPRHELRSPSQRAFLSGRKVSRLTRPWIAESHWQDGNASRVVEGFGVHAQPVTQPITTGILERYATGVHPGAGRLARYQQCCLGIHLQHRPGPERQVLGAKRAGAHVFQQPADRLGPWFGRWLRFVTFHADCDARLGRSRPKGPSRLLPLWTHRVGVRPATRPMLRHRASRAMRSYGPPLRRPRALPAPTSVRHDIP